MPFTYKIDTNLGLLYYLGFDVSMTEMLQVEKITSTDPLRLPSMKILIDLPDAELDVSMTDVYRMFCKAPGFRRGDVRNGFAYIIQRLAV